MRGSVIALLQIVITATIIAANENKSKKVLMCYIVSWSVYRTGKGKFTFSKIDPNLCTHIIYAYHRINDKTWEIETSDKWADQSIGGIRRLVDLKKENPNIKILISIGGWNEGESEKFSKVSADENKRNTFVQSIMNYLRRLKLDGIDIDWQFPVVRGGIPEDKENFVTLLQDLRKEFDTKGYILTVRLKSSTVYSEGYDLPKISDVVDYINLKSYSYHGTWEGLTKVNSPLSSNTENSVTWSVDYMLDEGVDSEKLLLGLTTEGNALLMQDEITDNKYIDKKITEGFHGPWVSEKGVIGYNELCWMFKREGDDWSHHWDDSSSTPYSVKGNQFTSYDDQQSFQDKLELVSERNLGGVSLFTIDKDDFNGLCFDKRYKLTRTVRSYLNNFNLKVDVVNQNFKK